MKILKQWQLSGRLVQMLDNWAVNGSHGRPAIRARICNESHHSADYFRLGSNCPAADILPPKIARMQLVPILCKSAAAMKKTRLFGWTLFLSSSLFFISYAAEVPCYAAVGWYAWHWHSHFFSLYVASKSAISSSNQVPFSLWDILGKNGSSCNKKNWWISRLDL